MAPKPYFKPPFAYLTILSDNTFDTTLKVEWVELTEYSPKSDMKTHENAPQRPQLKDVLSNGNKPQAYSHSINYNCLWQVMSYDTLCVSLDVPSAQFEVTR